MEAMGLAEDRRREDGVRVSRDQQALEEYAERGLARKEA